MLKMKPVVLAVATALVAIPQFANAANDAAIDVTVDHTSMPIPQNGIVDATAPNLKTGIAAIGNLSLIHI